MPPKTPEEEALMLSRIPGMNVKPGQPPKGAPVAGLADQITADDYVLSQMLATLQAEASGHAMNPNGSAYSRAQIIEAEERYLDLREFADEQRAKREGEEQARRDRATAEERARVEGERVRVEGERVRTEAEKVRIAEYEVRGRLLLEQERLQVEKAKAIIEMIEKIGSNPALAEQFAPMLTRLSEQLLLTAGDSDKEPPR